VIALHRLTDYSLSDLLHSAYGVAICQLAEEHLNATISELSNRRHRHPVLEVADGRRAQRQTRYRALRPAACETHESE
jgi:hypothetical protein